MSDTLTQVAALAKDWKRASLDRTRIVPNDPAALTLDYCAAELERTIEEARTAARYLTPEEYAAQKRVRPQTVRKWIARGWLPAEREGKQWRIRRDARSKAPSARSDDA